MTIMTNMASLDHHIQRRVPFPNGPTSHPIQNHGYMGGQTQNNGYPVSQAQALRVGPYMGTANAMMQHGPGDSMANLAHGFGAMGLHRHPSADRSSLQVAPAATMTNEYNNNGATWHSQGRLLRPVPASILNGHLVHNTTGPQASNVMHHQAGPYMQQSGPQNVYLSQMGLENAHSAQAVVPYHPANHWGCSRSVPGASHAMPTLVGTRRGSLSSNEEQIPATPYHHYGYGDVAVIELLASWSLCQQHAFPGVLQSGAVLPDGQGLGPDSGSVPAAAEARPGHPACHSGPELAGQASGPLP